MDITHNSLQDPIFEELNDCAIQIAICDNEPCSGSNEVKNSRAEYLVIH